jgi:dihydropyrimidine dehydrogenase (NAD+) subunit PreA
LPISGIGGITTWKDAAEFIALGCGNVQVCTAAMTYGFRIVQDMCDGLSNYMDDKGFASIEDFRGRAVPSIVDWKYLDLNHVDKAVINQDLCIQCGRCHVVCEDTSHQAITAMKNGRRHFEVKDDECVGCNLCVSVCPVPSCITLRALQPGEIDTRTGKRVDGTYANWTTHPNNPSRT